MFAVKDNSEMLLQIHSSCQWVVESDLTIYSSVHEISYAGNMCGRWYMKSTFDFYTGQFEHQVLL